MVPLESYVTRTALYNNSNQRNESSFQIRMLFLIIIMFITNFLIVCRKNTFRLKRPAEKVLSA